MMLHRRRPGLRRGPGLGLRAAWVFLVASVGCGEPEPPPPPSEVAPEDTEFAPRLGVELDQMSPSPSGLYIQDMYVGGGVEARRGREIELAYTGWLADGSVAFSSDDRGNWVGVLGETAMVTGWQEGVAGMREGGRRRIVVPARLGFGIQGLPPSVPPQAVLVISMELVDVR